MSSLFSVLHKSLSIPSLFRVFSVILAVFIGLLMFGTFTDAYVIQSQSNKDDFMYTETPLYYSIGPNIYLGNGLSGSPRTLIMKTWPDLEEYPIDFRIYIDKFSTSTYTGDYDRYTLYYDSACSVFHKAWLSDGDNYYYINSIHPDTGGCYTPDEISIFDPAYYYSIHLQIYFGYWGGGIKIWGSEDIQVGGKDCDGSYTQQEACGDLKSFYFSLIGSEGNIILNVYPDNPEPCDENIVYTGYPLPFTGFYDYYSSSTSTPSNFSSKLLIGLHEDNQDFGYSYSFPLEPGYHKYYSADIGAVASGTYSVYYKYIVNDLFYLDDEGILQVAPPDTQIFAYPDNADDICNSTTTYQVAGGSISPPADFWETTDFGGQINFSSGTEGYIEDEVGAFVSKWSNKFVSVLRERFPFNYFLTLTDWLLSFDLDFEADSSYISNYTFNFNFDGQEVQASSSGALAGFFGDDGIDVGNDSTHSFTYWTHLLSRFLMLYFFIIFSWEFLHSLFGASSGVSFYDTSTGKSGSY